ncbi:MAG: hypothetical protein QNI96_05265 [Woeseiaceae bacterium]|nr:hypothetical protein [Woeseiaceae bacterium]
MKIRSLINTLEAQVTESDSSVYEVGEQRERNHRYYTLQALGNEVSGRSAYISPDVFDVVEGKKAYFTETFFSGRRPIKFTATEGGSQDEADGKTAFVFQQLERNNWYELARDGWHDAFVAKRMVILPEWMDDTDTYVEEVQGLTPPALQQMIASDPAIVNIEPIEGETQTIAAGTGTLQIFSGTIEITRDTSYVHLKLIQPERYFRDPNVAYVRDAMYAGYSEDVSRAELINRKYSPEVVNRLTTDYRYRREEEDSARKRHDSSWTRRRLHKRNTETQTVTIYRTYTWLDVSDYDELMGGHGGADTRRVDPETLGLYEIHWAHGEIMEWADGSLCIRELEEIPFEEWTEHKISHAENGMATADIVAHTQKTNSTLKRLVIDNQQMRNTSRYEAVSGALKNPRELLDNNIGGVVWTSRLGSVAPLATPELSPLTMQAVEMLDQDKEERSGLSRLAQGMNTDAVRYQNADDMIARLTNAANRRIMRAARDFAKDLMIPLAKKIVTIAAQNDTKAYPFEITGKQVMVSPSQWSLTYMSCDVHTALTPDEGMKFAQTLLLMDAQLMQKRQTDPLWNIMYSAEEQHALYDDVFDALGVIDTSRYMKQPDSPEVAQAMQMMQAQQAEQQRAMQQQAMMQTGMMQSMDQREWFRAQTDAGKLQLDATDKASDNTREDEKFEHQKIVDFEELRLERESGNDAARSTSIAG